MKNIIITGATSGIGYELARVACEAGYRPILIARNMQRMQEVSTRLTKRYQIEVPIYQLDLMDSSQIAAVIDEIAKDYAIDVLINNAGYGKFESVEQMSFENLEGMFQVNVFALARLTQAALKHMRLKGEGHIMNIASLAGKMATASAGGYAASKHAVIGYTDALRLEVQSMGILVTTVNIGPTATNFFQVADQSGAYQKEMERFMLQPEFVARKMIARVGKKTREINLPRWMGLGAKLFQACPGPVEWIMGDRLKAKSISKKR